MRVNGLRVAPHRGSVTNVVRVRTSWRIGDCALVQRGRRVRVNRDITGRRTALFGMM
jgi:hypothetical protein